MKQPELQIKRYGDPVGSEILSWLFQNKTEQSKNYKAKQSTKLTSQDDQTSKSPLGKYDTGIRSNMSKKQKSSNIFLHSNLNKISGCKFAL